MPASSLAARLRRRLSRRWYRLLFWGYRRLFPTRVGAAPVDPRGVRRVLVLANYFVGDLVVATPALTFLRRHAPHARVDVVTAPRAATLFAGDPRVDRVLTHDAKRAGVLDWVALARRLRRERYDLVANFVLPHHLREGLLTAYVAGRDGARVTPYRPSRFAGLFTHRGRAPGFERRYMADRLLHAVRAALAVHDEAAYAPTLPVRPDADRRVEGRLREALGPHAAGPFVAMNAWASDPCRSFDPGQAAEVATAVVRRHPGLAVVLTPPPGAVDVAHGIAAAARDALAPGEAARVTVVPPSPDLGDLVALLARAAVVLTPDTANVHLAAAVGRPTVALYTPLGGTKMVHWCPPGRRHHAVAVEGRRPLRDLPAAAIVAAFDAVWAERDPGARPAARSDDQADRHPDADAGAEPAAEPDVFESPGHLVAAHGGPPPTADAGG